jgi:nucleoside-diphosphate-sugar epimerase
VVLGSGFVGSAVAAALDDDPDVGAVAILDIPTHPALGRRDDEARELVLAEIAHIDARAVVNTAGLLRGTDDEMIAANVSFPTWLVEVLSGSGVRFVHLGSAAEYGDPGSADPIPETAKVAPKGIYGESKWAGSSAVLAARTAGLDAVVARGFNLVAGQLPAVSPLHQFLTDVRDLPPEGGTVELWWPSTVRDFILLSDLAAVVARLALLDTVPDIVNVCSSIGVAFGDIVEALGRSMGKAVEITSLERPGIETVIGDNTRLRDLTGIRPEMSAALIAGQIDI